MIVVKLLGGLGNQMFQYALGRKMAILHSDELWLDGSFFSEKGSHTPREYELDIFQIHASLASGELLKQCIPAPATRMHRWINKWLGRNVQSIQYHEKGHAFQPEVFHHKGDIHLIGYWQSQNYFLDIADTIREDFTFRIPPQGLNADLITQMNSCNAVSIHIRRGDYVSNASASAFHGLCGVDYYQAAVERIAKGTPNIHLFIFSDDMEWVKQHLRFDYPMTYIDHNHGKQSWEDMRLMASCKHHIIANSSFSWWAAWLNPSTDKKVVAPSRWFMDASINTQDVLPTDWIKL